MTKLTNNDKSKIKFHYQQMTPISMSWRYLNLLDNNEFEINDYNRVISLIENCELVYEYRNNLPLTTITTQDITQNIQTVSVTDLNTTTTTYGNRGKIEKRRMTYNESLLLYSRSLRDLFGWLETFI
jgi:hypothetical protein